MVSSTRVAGTWARALTEAACAHARDGSSHRGKAAVGLLAVRAGTPVGSTHRGGRRLSARVLVPLSEPQHRRSLPYTRTRLFHGVRLLCIHLEKYIYITSN